MFRKILKNCELNEVGFEVMFLLRIMVKKKVFRLMSQ